MLQRKRQMFNATNKQNQREFHDPFQDEFIRKYVVRTDLALEAHQVIVENEGPPELTGVVVNTEETDHALISRVTVENEIGAKTIGKAPGHYSTIEAPVMRQHNREIQGDIAALLGKEIQWFLDQSGVGPEDPVLVVGLGNWNATPDALGPNAVEELMVTRHLLEMSPPELREGLRPVAAIAPGVLGLTGIETGEIIMGTVSQIGARALICIDALASRSVDRLCSTVQISDTGINPGSGVGNKRMAINQETIGIPVIAIGVPTVVHAATIVSDAMDLLNGRVPGQEQRAQVVPQKTSFSLHPQAIMSGQSLNTKNNPDTPEQETNPAPLGYGKQAMPEQQKMQMINQVLEPYMGNMIVTPKEIDELVNDVTHLIAGGLNTAFHEGVDYSEVFQYLS